MQRIAMVHLKKKVTIRTKAQAGQTVSESPPNVVETPRRDNLKKILLSLLVVAVVAIGGWYAYSITSQKTETHSKESANTAQTTQNEDSATGSDSTVTSTSPTADGSVTESPTGDSPNDGSAKSNVTANSPTPKASDSGQSAPAEPSVSMTGTVEQKAQEVIRGIYGNGQVRKDKLGSDYQTIQDKVNEMYRKGLVR